MDNKKEKDFLTGGDLEQKYYSGTLKLETISLEDLLVLIDYLGETELSYPQQELLDKSLERLSQFDDYTYDESYKQQLWNDVLLKEIQRKPIKHTRYSTRKRLATYILVAVISTFLITGAICSAKGINLINFIFNEDKGVISTNANSSVGSSTINYNDYDTFIQDNPTFIMPTYLPDGYKFKNAIYYNDENKNKIYITFNNIDNNTLLIIETFNISDDLISANNYEADIKIQEQYIHNDITFYIYSNNDKNGAIWSTDNKQISIDTVESIDEIKEIINSIY